MTAPEGPPPTGSQGWDVTWLKDQEHIRDLEAKVAALHVKADQVRKATRVFASDRILAFIDQAVADADFHAAQKE